MVQRLRKSLKGGRMSWFGAVIAALSLTVLPLYVHAEQLSPQQLFRRVAPSVVVIEVKEFPEGQPSRLIASGSGVVVPNRDPEVTAIATNCHLVDQARGGGVAVLQGSAWGIGHVEGRDAIRDLCLVYALIFTDSDGNLLVDHRGNQEFRKLPAVQVASSQWLEVGDTVYAVGAPQGLELTLSDGLVSGFREYEKTSYIQTTSPISSGSSGGGLFDKYGRLVGITTMYLESGQALNFAVPAEFIASVPMQNRNSSAGTQGSSDTFFQSTAAAAADAAAAEADPAPIRRDRWWTFYEDNEVEIAFDTETISWEGRKVIIWERATYKRPQRSSSGKTYIEDMSRATYYCDSRKHSFDQFIWRDVSGNVVTSQQLRAYEIEVEGVIPQTIGEVKYLAACGDH